MTSEATSIFTKAQTNLVDFLQKVPAHVRVELFTNLVSKWTNSEDPHYYWKRLRRDAISSIEIGMILQEFAKQGWSPEKMEEAKDFVEQQFTKQSI